MPEYLIIFLFALYISISFIISVVDVAGASFYDIAEYKKLKIRLKHPHSNANKYKPLISIVIPAFNEEKVIARCLSSIKKSSYKKYEVIVSDDASKDGTVSVVEKLLANKGYTKFSILKNKKNRGRGGAINKGIKKSTGALIIAMDADCIIEKDSFKNAVAHFSNPKINALAANVKIKPHMSVLGLLQQFEYITSFRSKKFNSLVNAEYIVGGAGAVYRKSILDKTNGFDESKLTEDIDLSLRIATLGNKEFVLKYASDYAVITEHVPTYKGLFSQRYRWKLGSLQALFASRRIFFSKDKKYSKYLTWYRLPMVIWSEITLLLEPLVLTYFIILAIVLNTPVLFIVSWAALILMLFFAIWGDDMLTTRQKLRFTMFMPIMYLLYYILSFIQIIAIIKSLINYKKITGKTEIKGTWISPERVIS